MNTPGPTVVPLASADASLALVGGKGQSLATLAAAGLPVPAGFLLSTTAYKDFVHANDLQGSILDIVATVKSGQVVSARLASTRIQSLFQAAPLTTQTATAIARAYAALGENGRAVAVRSSATAEDLPDLSFAGQHDSYLNVRGEAALLAAICRCWASLWTARAIDYRNQMHIDPQGLAMAVIVQVMVPADVSGILFTANPTNGDRSEMVINASFGLGEAIVGGDVTPDTYVLDRNSLETKQTIIGSKAAMTVSADEQGTNTQSVPDAKRGESSLSDAFLAELAALSLTAERRFEGVPQDIEWAAADGICWLLQSRPITNLPSAPLQDVSWDPPFEGERLIRRQVVENMPEPLSPLFSELYLQEGLEASLDQMMADYGMSFDIGDFMRRPLFTTVNGYAYMRYDIRFSWRLVRLLPKVLFWYITSARKILRGVIPRWRDESLPAYLATIEHWKAVDLTTAADEQLLSGVRALTVADAVYWFNVSYVMGMAKITDGLLNRFLTSRAVPGDLTSGVFLRGFASKTLQAQQGLEAIARRIHALDSLHDLVVATPAGDLLEALSHEPAGRSLRRDIGQHLERYGHQIYNLDFVQPTQLEDSLPVLLGLKALVSNPGYDTRARQAEMARARESRVSKTLESLGPLRRWLFRKFLGWAQHYGPHREQALFYVGAGWPTLRRLAFELGERLVAVGTLNAPDAVFYLNSAELVQAYSARKDGRALLDLGKAAERRRALREARKKLHPPGIVPQGSRWKIGPFDMSIWESQKRNADESNTLNGFAVSPGKVTGLATVILSPADFAQMKPDTILVCPTTTPAWTPLFAQASGLVTDIGGILAHGSIVAREYGIPAVMGTGNVTRRIVSGQRISVDGDTGTVTLLPDH